MDNITMSLGIYFEVKDAEIYGGEGTVGYAESQKEGKAWRSSATSQLKR